MRFQIRVEIFNVFNNVNYGNPNASFGSAAFGRITWPPVQHAAGAARREAVVLIAEERTEVEEAEGTEETGGNAEERRNGDNGTMQGWVRNCSRLSCAIREDRGDPCRRSWPRIAWTALHRAPRETPTQNGSVPSVLRSSALPPVSSVSSVPSTSVLSSVYRSRRLNLQYPSALKPAAARNRTTRFRHAGASSARIESAG